MISAPLSPPPCPSLFFLFSLVFKPERLDTDVLDLVQSLKFAFYDTAKCDPGKLLEALETGDSTDESFFSNDSFKWLGTNEFASRSFVFPFRPCPLVSRLHKSFFTGFISSNYTDCALSFFSNDSFKSLGWIDSCVRSFVEALFQFCPFHLLVRLADEACRERELSDWLFGGKSVMKRRTRSDLWLLTSALSLLSSH